MIIGFVRMCYTPADLIDLENSRFIIFNSWWSVPSVEVTQSAWKKAHECAVSKAALLLMYIPSVLKTMSCTTKAKIEEKIDSVQSFLQA